MNYKLSQLEVPRDGDCLLHSLIKGLSAIGIHYNQHQLRAELVNFIREKAKKDEDLKNSLHMKCIVELKELLEKEIFNKGKAASKFLKGNIADPFTKQDINTFIDSAKVDDLVDTYLKVVSEPGVFLADDFVYAASETLNININVYNKSKRTDNLEDTPVFNFNANRVIPNNKNTVDICYENELNHFTAVKKEPIYNGIYFIKEKHKASKISQYAFNINKFLDDILSANNFDDLLPETRKTLTRAFGDNTDLDNIKADLLKDIDLLCSSSTSEEDFIEYKNRINNAPLLRAKI